MVTLKVDGRRYKIDGNPTIEQWMQLQKWDFESPVHWQYIIEAVTGLPFYVIREMDSDQQRLAVTMIAYSMSERKQVRLPDFDGLTFGHFVDMEYLIAMGTDKTLDRMMLRLGCDHKHTQEALYVAEKYINWRNNIFKQYTGLFGLNDLPVDDEYQEKPNAKEVAGSWYRVIVELGNDDLTKLDEITNKPVKEVRNFMAIRKEKQLAELKRLKEQKRQHDLQRARR